MKEFLYFLIERCYIWFNDFFNCIEPSNPQSCHAGHKFHEVFQLKHGRYSDLPAAMISEMMKSNSLDVSFLPYMVFMLNFSVLKH